MTLKKKEPLRKCLGCNEMKPKTQLVRIVRSNEGEIFVDTSGKANGRGAYLCKSRDCFNKCRKAKRFEKSFSTQIDNEIYDKLESMVENG